jgi:SAM-dependent methyltransferase
VNDQEHELATPAEVWAVGAAYEPYVGRWSRPVARELVASLGLATDLAWLDVGCGTGALSQAVLAAADPDVVVGLDPSAGFVAYARARLADRRARFLVADARRLPFAGGRFDAVVSALVLNFVPDPVTAVREMAWVTRAGGRVAAYVWDYAGRMELIRRFWDAATSTTTGARSSAARARPPATPWPWTSRGARPCARSCEPGCRWPPTARSRWSPGPVRSTASRARPDGDGC